LRGCIGYLFLLMRLKTSHQTGFRHFNTTFKLLLTLSYNLALQHDQAL
jgi:hypothetical protein